MKKIIIGIGTCYRPRMLVECLDSVQRIDIPNDSEIEIIVADNAPEKNSKDLITPYSKARITSHYIVADEKGIASMRNKIIEKALKLNADYLTFIDDDEVVNKDWLVEHVKAFTTFNADVVTGYTQRILPQNIEPWLVEGKFFVKFDSGYTGELRKTSSTSNVFFDLKKLCIDFSLRFDKRLNFIGSSDLLFFNQAYNEGAKIIKCKEAIVKEVIPESRATSAWLLQRSYRRGNTMVARSFIQKGKVKTYFSHSLKAIREYFIYITRKLKIYTYSKDKRIHNLKTKRHLEVTRGIWNALYGKSIYEEYKKQQHGH